MRTVRRNDVNVWHLESTETPDQIGKGQWMIVSRARDLGRIVKELAQTQKQSPRISRQ